MDTPKQHLSVEAITATHCCVCQAQLTDAESVEHGIGPVCGGKYYNPQHVPTEEQVKVALGQLAVSGLPDEVIDGFLHVVDNNHVNARLGSNLLVKWASAHYNHREEVFKCSAIIRVLGYTLLADKLEIDRTRAAIFDRGDYLEVFVSDKWRLERDLRQIPGLEMLTDPEDQFERQLKRGQKVGWKVPKAHEEQMECVIGLHLGPALVCGTGGIRVIPRKRLSDLFRFKRPTAVSSPPATHDGRPILFITPNREAMIVAGHDADWIHVYTPYHSRFIEDLKRRVSYKERQWDRIGRYWLVRLKRLADVKVLIDRWFTGTTPPP